MLPKGLRTGKSYTEKYLCKGVLSIIWDLLRNFQSQNTLIFMLKLGTEIKPLMAGFKDLICLGGEEKCWFLSGRLGFLLSCYASVTDGAFMLQLCHQKEG